MVQIEILTGPESGRLVDVVPGARTFGRASGCDIVLTDSSVSGRHLEIQVAASGAVRFRDLGSTNGTWSGGVQVQDGEWFVGSELKLGGCAMRLLDPSAAGKGGSTSGSDDDADLHRRAREAALSGGRKGGLLQLLAVLVVVAGGGGAAWWFLGGDGGEGEGGGRGPGNPGGPTIELDLIDNLGDFTSPESWSLTGGIEIVDGRLRGGTARGRATLTRDFPGATALRFSGQAQAEVVPIVSWGVEGEEAARGEWAAPALTAAGVELALPNGADWFRLALDVPAGAEVSALKVEEGSASVRKSTAPAGSVRSTSGKLAAAGQCRRAADGARVTGRLGGRRRRRTIRGGRPQRVAGERLGGLAA